MDLNYFKDHLFDLLNESEEIDLTDVRSDDRNNLLATSAADGSVFEFVCQKIR